MASDPAASVPGLRRIDHIGVIVDDLAAAGRLLADTLGLAHVGGTENPRLRTAFYRCGDASIEVVEVLEPDLRRQRLGEGVQARIEHIAIEVDDLDQTLGALEALGIHANAPARISGDYRTFWTEPSTSGGIMLQFLERDARPPASSDG